ncbi:MAG: TetR/AcrR family transcriptional regulator, partial [Tomitella sp.]|nr:TetR/AcrR family transcriptional regulator [Tomitella sp.]
ADDLAADRLIEVLELTHPRPGILHATVRAYGGLIKSAGREWIIEETLTREQVHEILATALVAIVLGPDPESSAG